MFKAWQQEKAIDALKDEAQAMAEKLASARPHVIDSHAATAWFWATSLRADGQDVQAIASWPPATVARFVTQVQARIAALRKARDYDLSDGLAVWLHTARAVTHPRILPAACEIWQMLLAAGPNAESMAQDLLAEAGLSATGLRQAPAGFAPVAEG
jgi:hypothetical protein